MGEADFAHPGLWFTGFKPIFTGYFDAAGVAAKRIADRIELTIHSAPAHSAGRGTQKYTDNIIRWCS